MVVFWQVWLYLRKMVVFEQNGSFWVSMVVLCKMVVFRKYCCIWASIVVFRQKNIWAKCFHLGSIVVSEQMLLYLRQLVVFGQKGYI